MSAHPSSRPEPPRRSDRPVQGWRRRERIELPKNSGHAFEVRAGECARVIGQSVVDLVAFNLADLRERFDQARTKSNQAKIFLSTGDVLYSKLNRPMMTIVADGFPEGRHDLQKGTCSRERFRLVAEGRARRLFVGGRDLNPSSPAEIPDHGCWENLIDALDGRGIDPVDIPSPFNIFQTMEIDPRTGVMLDSTTRPARPTNVDLRAEMDLLVAVSACPESGRGRPIAVEILEPVDA
jgi:uncharacterized protein YcgI (DUF1989 family)